MRYIYILLIYLISHNTYSQEYLGLINRNSNSCFGDIKLKTGLMNERLCLEFEQFLPKSWDYNHEYGTLWLATNNNSIKKIDLNTLEPMIEPIQLSQQFGSSAWLIFEKSNNYAYFLKIDFLQDSIGSSKFESVLIKINLKTSLSKELLKINNLAIFGISQYIGGQFSSDPIKGSQLKFMSQGLPMYDRENNMIYFNFTDLNGTPKIIALNTLNDESSIKDLPTNYAIFELEKAKNSNNFKALVFENTISPNKKIGVIDYNYNTNTFSNFKAINTIQNFDSFNGFSYGRIMYNIKENNIWAIIPDDISQLNYSTYKINVSSNDIIEKTNFKITPNNKMEFDFRYGRTANIKNTFAIQNNVFYPTIAKSEVMFKSKTLAYEIIIINTLGEKIVLKTENTGDCQKINITGLNNGIYYFLNPESNIFEKIIVRK